MKITLKLMNDQAEIIQSYLPYVRIGIQCNKLSDFNDMKALCHWHEDIELIKILSGEMYYYVNGKTFVLKKGDGIIVNAKAMHYGYSLSGKDCDFICVLINPMIFSAEKTLFQKFVEPVINTKRLEANYLSFEEPAHLAILQDIETLGNLHLQAQQSDDGIDMECMAVAYQCWHKWFNLVRNYLNQGDGDEPEEIVLQKKMTSFIHQNYMHPLRLDSIAASAHICRSRCCKLFKKYVQQSPMSFLNAYRIEVSQTLLVNTSLSITEIALNSGFNHLSYFSKQFYLLSQCTPKQYRQRFRQVTRN
ncbi:AraC family transcriptional regulator [Testudinibacter sp. P80/BLE/0925]|uniref:AraC family transcriptional regulator n=1 Tax=Testudinibacter sp. TW-1 TaxID=3417757 RepID=UPI003D36502A